MVGEYRAGEVTIEWLGHDAFRVRRPGVTVYFDPYNLRGYSPRADLILVSHEHFDHCSPGDIAGLLSEKTIVAAPRIAVKCVGKAGAPRIIEAKAWTPFNAAGVTVTPVPAYNVNKYRSPGRVYHPRGDGRVGYVAELGGVKIYHAGDTDLIPEMERLKDMGIDVALLPVSGVYVMTPEEAAEAARLIRPKVAIPMHYGSIVASEKEAKRFKDLLSGEIDVVILERKV